MNRLLFSIFLATASFVSCEGLNPEQDEKAEQHEYVYLDAGRMKLPSGKDARLYGVNFQTPISWEYAGHLQYTSVPKTAQGLNSVTDANIEDLALMGINHLRCHLTPVDLTDPQGNLVEESIFLDALDYMIFKAKEKGMYLSFAFLNHMSQPGTGTWITDSKQDLIQNPETVRLSREYIKQLVNHVNKYTGVALKDEKSIAYWELINEPQMYLYSEIEDSPCSNHYHVWLESNAKADNIVSYSEYTYQTVKDYIDDTIEMLRQQGDGHLVCYGLNWHRFRNGRADYFAGVADSKCDLVAFCNYPGQDQAGKDYTKITMNLSDFDFSQWFWNQGTDLNGYGWVLSDEFAGKGKVVYEFEGFFNQSNCIYPTQATFFRSKTVQSCSMWTYTFNEIAPRWGGSHYLNLRCTPGKAASMLVAQELFRNLPHKTALGVAPFEQREHEYAISLHHDGAVYSTDERFVHSGHIGEEWNPLPPKETVRYVAGCGGCPIVEYSGSGVYFIEDKGSELSIVLMPDVNVTGDIFNRKVTQEDKVLLDYDNENTLSILLKDWKNRAGTLYCIGADGKRQSLGQIDGTQNLKCKSGRYVVVPL